MGNERDWSQERERPSKEQENETTWSSLSNGDDEHEFDTYHPAPPNHYIPGMMEQDCERLLKRYPFPESFQQQSPPQAQDTSSSDKQLS